MNDFSLQEEKKYSKLTQLESETTGRFPRVGNHPWIIEQIADPERLIIVNPEN